MMTDGSWAMWLTVERGRLVVALGHRVERHQGAARRADLHAAQHLVGVGVLRIGLEDDLVGVVGRVDGRDSARAEGRVEQQADLVDRQAETRGGVAVDVDHRRARLDLQVGVHVGDRRNALHALFHKGRVFAQERQVAGAHAELVLGAALRGRDVDRLDRLVKDVDAGHRRRRAAQAGDDLPVAVAVRSPFGRSVMKIRPELTVLAALPPPTVDITETTSGSRLMTSASADWRATMASNEASSGPTVEPVIWPISSDREEAFRDRLEQVGGQRRRCRA